MIVRTTVQADSRALVRHTFSFLTYSETEVGNLCSQRGGVTVPFLWDEYGVGQLYVAVNFLVLVYVSQTFRGAMEKPEWLRQVRMGRSGQGQPGDVLR